MSIVGHQKWAGVSVERKLFGWMWIMDFVTSIIESSGSLSSHCRFRPTPFGSPDNKLASAVRNVLILNANVMARSFSERSGISIGFGDDGDSLIGFLTILAARVHASAQCGGCGIGTKSSETSGHSAIVQFRLSGQWSPS
jgi:hypothetical protein